MSLDQLIAAAIPLAPIVYAVVEIIKLIIPDLKARFIPLLSLLAGLACGMAIYWSDPMVMREKAIVGFIAALIASGVFMVGKSQEGNVNNTLKGIAGYFRSK